MGLPLRALAASRRGNINVGGKKRFGAAATAATLLLAGVGAARSYAAAGPASRPADAGIASAANTGSLRVPDSAYAIPPDARFVSAGGSDHNAGSESAPFRTIAHAVAATPAGGTVVVRAGTYRESLGHVTKRLTIQAFPHEQVWLKGSVVVTGFSPAGGAWVKTGWSPSLCHRCFSRAAIDPAYPAAGLPDQVFVDGAPQAQVTRASALRPGTFYVDARGRRLLLGSNPAGHQVEATYFSIAMQFDNRASGSRLLGIGVSEYGPHFTFDQPAMVIGNADDLTFDHDAFDWSATRGLSVYRPGSVVENSSFLYDGANGLHANRADGFEVVGNTFAFSNFEHFSIASGATASIAAMKVTYTTNAVVEWNTFTDNAATAVWFDLDGDNVVIAHNHMARNDGFGVMYEVSARGTIVGNIISAAGRDGIRISGSTNTRIAGNLLVGNAWAQLGVYEDPRTQPNGTLRHDGITWDTAGITAVQNVLAAGTASTGPLFDSFDASHPHQRTTLQMLGDDGENVFVQPGSQTAADVAAWQLTLRGTTQLPTLADLQRATGHEHGSSTVASLPAADAQAVANIG